MRRERPFGLCRRLVPAVVLAVALIPTATTRVEAQARVIGTIGEQPDSTRLALAMRMAMRMRSPASMVLEHKTELGLSPEQVGYLEALVKVEADSARVRSVRLMTAMQEAQRKRPATSTPGDGWTSPIDEATIRADACAQSALQADMMIGMLRDRHAVGAVLTPAQVQELLQLETRIMTEGMRPPNK